MPPADELLFCTPEPRLCVGEDVPRVLAAAFAKSDASGLLHLATSALKDDIAAPLAWAREWGRQFFARLCQTRDPATVEPPDVLARTAFLAEAPPLRGAEYLDDALLLRLWQDLRAAVADEAAAHAGGLEGWLRERSALWHLVGRVTLHLAENKRNEQLPFAFLATYTDQLSAAGQLQHTPLGRALQIYAGKKDQATVVNWVRSNSHDTIMGKISFNPDGEIIGFPWVIYQVKGGKFAPVAVWTVGTKGFDKL